MEHVDHKAFCHGVHRVGLPGARTRHIFVERIFSPLTEISTFPDTTFTTCSWECHEGENRSRIHVPVGTVMFSEWTNLALRPGRTFSFSSRFMSTSFKENPSPV